ncbi:MAG TPA: hypothetical protein VG759_15170 [Candidatus Angelobacter sp.]|nr:hypothetical protein [Candidatus Angelobacter sp.]
MLAGLIAVATSAAGKCASRGCGEATLHLFELTGCKISDGFLIQSKSVEFLLHFGPFLVCLKHCQGSGWLWNYMLFYLQLASIGGIGYRVSHQGQRAIHVFSISEEASQPAGTKIVRL